MNDIHLIPVPKQLRSLSGYLNLNQIIHISHLPKIRDEDLLITDYINNAFSTIKAAGLQRASDSALPTDSLEITVQISPHLVGKSQGYRLSIMEHGISLIGNDKPGLFYAACTLKQLLALPEVKKTMTIPHLHIFDWPDFPNRGVMLDISRDKVPTMETLFMLVDIFADLKINQLQLYTEHTFAYPSHQAVWADSSPMTGEEIVSLDKYCSERFIELIPNQNSFGHMRRWFKHSEYSHLGELYEIQTDNWWGQSSFSLSPVNPGSIKLVKSLYDELLPYFSSKTINVGCDETFDLGLGHSKTAVETKGKGNVYLDFLLEIYADLSRRGYTMQFWGDIILEHSDLVPKLPLDVIALEWGYEANHDFEERTRVFSESGIPFYVCPGTSSWNSIAGRVDNAIENLQKAALYGLRNGAIGYLNTDWGDNGHWQQLPISYLGYVVGAAYAWSDNTLSKSNLEISLSWHVFKDYTLNLSKAAMVLGNLYKKLGSTPANSSTIFHLLQKPSEEITKSYSEITINMFDEVIQDINFAADLIHDAKPETTDNNLLLREFMLTTKLLNHAAQRGKLIFFPSNSYSSKAMGTDLMDLVSEYKNIWLNRNRSGGLSDSIARFDTALRDYQTN